MNMTMEELVNKLNSASKAYYGGAGEILSDKEFDSFYDALVQAEKESGTVLPNSPTQHVGFKVVSKLPKVKHEYPSLSLDKTKDICEMQEWLGENEGVLSWKYDGLTVILTYDDGKLVRAETRGDGTLGEDITHNAIHFKGVPRYIADDRHIIIRGEAIIFYDVFKTINNQLPGDKQYKNPRSMVSGATRFMDSSKSAAYNITFMPFDLANAEILGYWKISESMKFISSIGFSSTAWWIVDEQNLTYLIDQKTEEAKTLPYSTDGLVVIYDDLNLCGKLGTTTRYPKYAKAFKWPDTTKTTILRDIDWSVAESGLISPIAIFDPVELEGTIVKRASVHNLSIMRKLGLGIGDHINVYKANMIIPQIYDDIERSNNIEIPSVCPVCGSLIDRRLGANGTSEFLYCINEFCKSKGEKT